MEEVRFYQRCGSPTESQFRHGRLRPVCTKCGAISFADPKVVVAVIAEMGGKIVMIRRDNEPGRGKWTIPGGFADRGEIVEEAAAREFLEETGLKTEVTGLIGVYSKSEDTNILVVYGSKLVGGELVAGQEAQDVGLFDIESLPPLAFERDVSILKEWQAAKARRRGRA
ncbi:MAG: NUDIX domain-containing protein [Dehalococcoidia bacterium]|nr:NUDIX domain-containing protein [Dehalococcoidia bacterium]